MNVLNTQFATLSCQIFSCKSECSLQRKETASPLQLQFSLPQERQNRNSIIIFNAQLSCSLGGACRQMFPQ
jgi:hypothetical protein